MSGWKKAAIVFAIAYCVFYSGGRWSFEYTHQCVRSHIEEVYNPNADDVEEVTVCDWYTANAKRWTFFDPIRATIGSVENAAVLAGIAAVLGGWTYRRHRKEERAQRIWDALDGSGE